MSSSYEFIILGFIIGFITGVIATLLFYKNNTTSDKVIALLVVGMWLAFHAFAFFTDLNVAWIFDIVGAGSAGHLIGLDLVEVAKKFKRK